MGTAPIGRGTVLAGRYRLEDLLAESEGARFWRATDTILARSVAIHAVASEDPRAPGLLEAARVSATVTDPHLLRVLDCDDEDGISWVVNEWGDGISLDLMLEQGVLPPSRAAWLAREVAEAIASGHAQGVAHGRLNPESVLVTHAGAVKLIGYVVDASLAAPRPPDPLYGELDEREADVINLAGILYAALTGRWPGVTRSAVPQAPREARRPLRPRQVRAGVPRTLDAICDRVLHKEASRHTMPIETAHEIAAALADYIGDPMLNAPLDAAGSAEPTVSLHRDTLPAPDPDLPGPPSATPLGTSPTAPPAVLPAADEPADEPTVRAPDTGGDPATDWAPDPATDWAPDWAPDNTGRKGGETGAMAVDPDSTQTFRPTDEEPTVRAPARARADRDSPLPPFPDLPERPLFAPTERRVPPAAWAAETGLSAPWSESEEGSRTGGSPRVADTSAGRGGHDSGQGLGHDAPPPGTADFWPFDGEPAENEVHTGKEGRGWLRMAIVVGVLLVVVVAMAIAFTRGRQDGAAPSGSGENPSSPAQAQGKSLKLAGVTDFDPLGNPPQENPETTGNAIDGNPATSWQTSTYRGNAALGGLKPGVGLMVDLGKDQDVQSVTVQLKGAPTSLEVYAAPSGVTQSPDSLDQLDKVGSRAEAPERTTVQLDPTPTTRYLLVWLTRLPQVSGGFRGEIVDISASS